MFKVCITYLKSSTTKEILVGYYDISSFLEHLSKIFDVSEYKINYITYVKNLNGDDYET